MASPFTLRELRYISSTTFNKTYLAANGTGGGSWDPPTGAAIKLRALEFDHSGLEYAAERDMTIQQRRFSRPAPIPTIRSGQVTFSTYLGAGESTTGANPVATLLSKALGNIATPTARTYTLDSSGVHTTSRIYAAGIEAEAVGSAVLVGSAGDGDGEGEVREIVATGANYLDLHMALSGAPADGQTVVIGTTVYPDEDADQEHIDLLMIGHAADDQWQTIGGQMTGIELAGTGTGELPMINWTYTAADWQIVPSGERDAFTPTSASQGNAPPVNLGLGGLFIADENGATPGATRTVYKGGNFAMPNLGASVVPIPDVNGINRIGGWCKTPPEDGFTASVSLLYDEDMPGLYADFTGNTAKSVLMQFGNTAQKCCAISLPRAYVSTNPKPADLDGLSAVEVSFVANESAITTNDLTLAAVRIHYF